RPPASARARNGSRSARRRRCAGTSAPAHRPYRRSPSRASRNTDDGWYIPHDLPNRCSCPLFCWEEDSGSEAPGSFCAFGSVVYDAGNRRRTGRRTHEASRKLPRCLNGAGGAPTAGTAEEEPDVMGERTVHERTAPDGGGG